MRPLERGLRWDLAAIDDERRLDQTGDSGRAHRVADVRLHRRQHAVDRPARVLGEVPAQRAELGGIADRGRGAVGLDVADRVRREPGLGLRARDRVELAVEPRRHRTFPAAVVVDADAADHRVDAIAIAHRIGQPLHDDGADALAEHEPVGALVERPARVARRQRADPREPDEVVGRQVQVHATRDRDVAHARAQRQRGVARGDQRARAGRVDRERGAAQIERVRHARRRHVEEISRDRERAQRRHVLDHRVDELARRSRRPPPLTVEQRAGAQPGRVEVLVLGHARTDVHAGASAREHVLAVTGVLECDPHGVEQQPMLRIHHAHPQRREPVMHRRERPHVVEHRDLARVRLVDRARARIVEQRVVPALRRDLREAHARVADVAPVGAHVGRLRKHATHPDDRDVARRRPAHDRSSAPCSRFSRPTSSARVTPIVLSAGSHTSAMNAPLIDARLAHQRDAVIVVGHEVDAGISKLPNTCAMSAACPRDPPRAAPSPTRRSGSARSRRAR